MQESKNQVSRQDVAREQGRELASTATDEARSMVDVSQHEGQQMLKDVRTTVHEEAEAQAHRALQSLRSVRADLHNMAEGNGPPSAPIVDVTEQVASQVGKLADRLESRGVDGSLDDLRGYARRRPGRFLFGAFAAGFLIGRVVRNVDAPSLDTATEDPDEDRASAGEIPTREPGQHQEQMAPSAIAATDAAAMQPGHAFTTQGVQR